MFSLQSKGRTVVIKNPLVMGIINITPDSFYAGSRQQTIDAILKKAEQMLMEDADILDIGGQSTRPGSEALSVEEELQRVMAPIEAITKRFPDCLISIDTYFSKVATEAIHAGAFLINDISAGSLDENMFAAVASLHVPYILMHMKGTPQNMQRDPQYENVITEIADFFSQKISILNSFGIRDIIIDPGFGFGKTIQHNFEILRHLSVFKNLNCPIMAGLSRKATIYKTLGVSADEALNGTTVLNTIALLNGASLLRVHDVKEAKEAVRLYGAYIQ